MPENQETKGRPRVLFSLLITVVIGVVWFYITLPAINLKDTSFYGFVLMLLFIYIILTLITLGADTGKPGFSLKDYFSYAKNQSKIVLVLVVLFLAVLIVGEVISSPIIRAGAYYKILNVDTGSFATDIEEVSFNEIPMLDESSARRLGDRKLGELSDMVSQFEVAYDYTQINYQGRPVRVASLEYGDIFKWFINTRSGLPAYVTVDMVTQEAQVVRLESLGLNGMRISPSEYLNRDLTRTLRFRYPTYMFLGAQLEIDEEGTPWWVCPRMTKTIGLFGGTDIIGAVLLNACTGESTYYDVADIPNWVDRVYSASLICQQYDYHGMYSNGFINSLIGQKDVTVTTNGYNYLAMNDDVYMYTGITSVNSDQSNIGFLLSNQRTKDTVYYTVAGAIEESAMESAQGVVQDLGYVSTFPLLLNIGGQPTYFMSLKDGADLVKSYAMVNVSQYQIVATGATVAACESNYLSLLAQNNISVTTHAQDIVIDLNAVSGKIAEIRSAVIGGSSWYYIRLEGSDTYYAISAAQDRSVVVLNPGDPVTVSVDAAAAEAAIMDATAVTVTEQAAPAPEQPADTGAPEGTEEEAAG